MDRNGLGQLKTGQDGMGLLRIHLSCPVMGQNKIDQGTIIETNADYMSAYYTPSRFKHTYIHVYIYNGEQFLN